MLSVGVEVLVNPIRDTLTLEVAVPLIFHADGLDVLLNVIPFETAPSARKYTGFVSRFLPPISRLAISALALPSASVVVVEPSLFVTVTVVLPSDEVPVVTVGE